MYQTLCDIFYGGCFVFAMSFPTKIFLIFLLYFRSIFLGYFTAPPQEWFDNCASEHYNHAGQSKVLHILNEHCQTLFEKECPKSMKWMCGFKASHVLRPFFDPLKVYEICNLCFCFQILFLYFVHFAPRQIYEEKQRDFRADNKKVRKCT